jgi:hypothetical protein
MGRTVILSDEVSTACDIADSSRNDLDKTPFAEKTMRHLPTPGRSSPLWMAAAVLAMTWASETQAFPDLARPLADAQHETAARNLDSVGTVADGDFEALPPSRGGNDKSVQVVQAPTSDTGQSPEREHHWAEALSCELTNARRDIELLQRLEQQRDRAEWLEQGLAAARRDVETQTALTAKAVEETARVKQAAQSGPELQNSLQQARERAERLALELAAARRDVETQTALAARASEEAARTRQEAERESAGLRSSLQQERARAERLESDLALAQRAASNAVTVGSIARDKSVGENAKPVVDRAPAAGVRGAAQPNSEQAAVAAGLVARASALLGQGNIGAARIVLERAVEMGSAQASFSLAETYDPLILAKWGTYGTHGDAIKAQDLYVKAEAAGIQEAKARFEALRR